MKSHDLFGPSVTVHLGDCLDVMPTLPDNSIDAVVCDPPYHLTSIVKRFGAGNAAPVKDATFGRMSRGFMGKEWDGGDIAFRPETWAEVLRVLKPGGHLLAFSGSRTYHRMACAIEDAGFEIRDQIMWVYGSGFPKSHDVSKGIDKAAGAERARTERAAFGGTFSDDGGTTYGTVLSNDAITPNARKWQGWGSALKPAHEPIVMARKPLIGTIVENVLLHGTGAINIDGCRIHGEDTGPRAYTSKRTLPGAQQNATGERHGTDIYEGVTKAGRFPANLIHDGSDEVVDCFPEGAARFFYAAKASNADRAGSKHPTVKPIALMRYLVRMITPRNGLVLDPFAGSGTTLMAAKLEGFDSIGIEFTPEYYDDIKRRFGL